MSNAAAPPAPLAARTKIIATVGPASSAEEKLRELVLAGVSVFRLNMAHGSRDAHAAQVDSIRRVSRDLGRPVGILVDLAGPKIRLGELPGGQLDLHEGVEVRFVRGEQAENPGELVTTYKPLVDELAKGDRVVLADGTVTLRVVEKLRGAVRCIVEQDGVVRSRQGVNLPGVRLSTPALSADDRENVTWLAQLEIDFVGLSFVRSVADVHGLKTLLHSWDSPARVIAKIEKPEALEALPGIVEAADGVMIARGDLGVEIDVAQVPMAQKRIIAVASRLQKPVITATQMLDSMQSSRYPTRAEASDVANAIIDGTDACMLSGETAIGRYPRAAVEMMSRISLATEPYFADRPWDTSVEQPAAGLHANTAAAVQASSSMSRQLGARLLVVASRTGAAALAVSKQRNPLPVVGVSPSPVTLRQMTLYWGIIPLEGAPTVAGDELMQHLEAWGRPQGLVHSGDRVVFVSGHVPEEPVQQMLAVIEVP